MDIDKWIEENSYQANQIGWGDEDEWVIDTPALKELLQTHALVPREPTDKQIQLGMNEFDAGGQKLMSEWVRVMYKAMLSDNE